MSESTGTGLNKESTAAGGDFFSRLAGQNMGVGSVIRPLTAPRFAPGPAALDDTSREIMTEFFPSSFPAARKLERKISHIGESGTQVDEYRFDDEVMTSKGAKGRGGPGVRETGARERESRPDAVDSVKQYGRSSDGVAGTAGKTVEPRSAEQRQRKWNSIGTENIETKHVEAMHTEARNIETKGTIEKGSEEKDIGTGDTRENVIETSRTVEDDKEEPGEVLRGEGMHGQSIGHALDADVSFSPVGEAKKIFTTKGTKDTKEEEKRGQARISSYRSQITDPSQIRNSETEVATYIGDEKKITEKEENRGENRGQARITTAKEDTAEKSGEKRGQAGKTREEIREEIRGQARKISYRSQTPEPSQISNSETEAAAYRGGQEKRGQVHRL